MNTGRDGETVAPQTASRTMRLSQVVAPGRSEFVKLALPEPGYGEVLVAVEACGVCASELHPWIERQTNYPFRLGHEPAGTVAATGPGVTRVRPGDRVTGCFSPAYGEFSVASENDVLPIPEGVPSELALGEPLACLVNGLRRTRVELADRVSVIGLGFMGLGVLQLLKLRGAGRIIAVDPRRDAREKAMEFGADEAYGPRQVPARYLLTDWADWQGPRGVEIAIEASGTEGGLALAGQMVRAHGILSIFGFHQGHHRKVDVAMWNWKAIDVINAHVRRRTDLMESMRIGLALLADGRFSFEPLVTHRFGLGEVDEAFGVLRTKPPGFIKAVVLT